jgi:hypothetical protein
LLATTGWQLVAGGLLVAPVALAVEGPPPATLTAGNLAGYAYLTIVEPPSLTRSGFAASVRSPRRT